MSFEVTFARGPSLWYSRD